MGSVWTIVVAAGSGSRFGSPKQYQPLGDRRVIDWSLRAARSVSDGVVLVVPAERRDDPEPAADLVVAGHASRSGSVRAGLTAVPADAEVIVVHDGARPLATTDVFLTVIEAIREGATAAVPSMPVTDTIRSRTTGVIDRADLVTVQTPQAFLAADLRAAHASGLDATDDACLVEAIGGRVTLVAGSAINLKLTYPTDLLIAESLLHGIEAEPSPALRRRDGTGRERR